MNSTVKSVSLVVVAIVAVVLGGGLLISAVTGRSLYTVLFKTNFGG